MKIRLLVIGKTDKKYLEEGIETYLRRIVRYLPFEYVIIPDVKNARSIGEQLQKEREGIMLLEHIRASEELALLDAGGTEYSSTEFAGFIEGRMTGGLKSLCFAVGGPYGFSRAVYDAATTTVSLSRMTFSHQIVRLLFAEQLYRALTIIKGEPYHHE
ncbi:MAG: 23S rRNA (pseudouridine(1915)-N(3))-methyltransferase RlmH [Bacteroidales bacterium]|jgi:23S rRNA (pseudouridine1915-N3)-methyltransferase|nr:23S rRNA (pseudouridine(1915)-N(3))-methyltransferase RlmH [Bacteroidales bacterium]